MTPTRISYHPNNGIILHYGDRQVAMRDIPSAERLPLFEEIVRRYNAHDTLVDFEQAQEGAQT